MDKESTKCINVNIFYLVAEGLQKKIETKIKVNVEINVLSNFK